MLCLLLIYNIDDNAWVGKEPIYVCKKRRVKIKTYPN